MLSLYYETFCLNKTTLTLRSLKYHTKILLFGSWFPNTKLYSYVIDEK